MSTLSCTVDGASVQIRLTCAVPTQLTRANPPTYDLVEPKALRLNLPLKWWVCVCACSLFSVAVLLGKSWAVRGSDSRALGDTICSQMVSKHAF
eukprot:3866568-Pyramimonas_sp.AAC.1